MKQKISGILILLTCCLLWSCQPPKTFTLKEISLIPQVRKMTLGTSSFKFGESTGLTVQNKDQQAVAEQFSSLLPNLPGGNLKLLRVEQLEQIRYFSKLMKRWVTRVTHWMLPPTGLK